MQGVGQGYQSDEPGVAVKVLFRDLTITRWVTIAIVSREKELLRNNILFCSPARS